MALQGALSAGVASRFALLDKASHYQRAEREALEAKGPGTLDTPKDRLRAEAEARKEALRGLEERNVSATQLLERLGFCEETRKAPNKKITGTDDIFREIMEASFALLPEDGPSTVGRRSKEGTETRDKAPLSEKAKAAMQYAAFSNEEKLALIDEKLEQLTQQIERQSEVRGTPTDLLLVQLRDHLEAAKQAFLEGQYLEETSKRVQKKQGQMVQQQHHDHDDTQAPEGDKE
ncbi:hypothetical protein cyc_05617 [Cyclospora cayetanensis]|uniref:Uncharacterized protein n=1 Tax=Cyclospora cayetanensis TaxID=88456 RepID=A0A1D3D1I9_9EIME|nr:hypothetical protein cyc_05617 [Cyclospora cayetanensis]